MPNGGLVVMTDSFLVTHRAQITALAARFRLPTVYPFRDFIELGGLLFYGMTCSIVFSARRPTPIASSAASPLR
jgi:hypothetical protein